jgi:hypothetical protein
MAAFGVRADVKTRAFIDEYRGQIAGIDGSGCGGVGSK